MLKYIIFFFAIASWGMEIEYNPVQESAVKLSKIIYESAHELELFSKSNKDFFDESILFAKLLGKSNLLPETPDKTWEILGRTYLDLAKLGLTTKEQIKEAEQYFEKELKLYINANKCSYQWFILFVCRLTILLTNLDLRENPQYEFNARFDKYIHKLANYKIENELVWYKHENFKNACKTLWSNYTIVVATTKSDRQASHYL
jgi:hypothetical protein